MGRLIDEDVLLKNLEWLEDYDHYVLHDVKMTIDETPTVNAIPVDFIENWLNGFMKEINGRTYYCGEGYDSAQDLLDAWEKEK